MKMLFPLLIATTVAISGSHDTQAQTLPTQAIDSIAAVVDENVILRSELDQATANISARFASQPSQLPPRDVLEKQVLERLILSRLQVLRANDSGIRISDPELQQAITTVANNNKMTVDQLRQQLASDRLGFDEFRNNMRDEITIQRLRQRYIQSQVQISEAEIDQLLATTQVGGNEVRLANIQISLAEGATPDDIATAKEKIIQIKNMIERGETDFNSAAVHYSQAQNALDGGEIGWRTFESIPPAFVSVLKDMKPGQITDPIRGQSGFQIVQLEETREPQAQTVVQFHAQDILIVTSELVSAEAAQQKIDALRARIVAGEDFAKVAKEASDDGQTRAQGGDMGWFQAEQWGTAIATQVQQLADGELSPVFQSDVGFHLIRRLGTREQDMTAENKRNKAREILGQRKAEEVYDRFLRQLRAEAYVENRLGGS